MKSALNSATFIKLPTWLSDFVSASVKCSFPLQSNVRFQMTFEDFPFSDNQIYTPLLHLFLSKLKIALGSSSSFPDWCARIVCKNCTCPDIHRNFTALQSQWYTRPSGFLTRSSNQSESSQVNQIRRSIFLSSSLLPSPFSLIYM